jgi:N utilization substance protein A
MVVSELRGEKIDIIPWNPEPARFVAKALSPARVREVYLDDDAREATVVVPDDQLALAIGKEGMNARLAHRLTGWKIDIVSDTEFAQQEAEAAFAGEEGEEGDFSGRCAAILSNGKRCPNAALPGSKYCGVPAHQALADQATEQVVEPEPELEAEAELADVTAAGPGDAPVAGEDETLETGGAQPQRVEDDPHAGIPIEVVAVEEQIETPVDVTGGAGLEQTLEGHATTEGEPPYEGSEPNE